MRNRIELRHMPCYAMHEPWYYYINLLIFIIRHSIADSLYTTLSSITCTLSPSPPQKSPKKFKCNLPPKHQIPKRNSPLSENKGYKKKDTQNTLAKTAHQKKMQSPKQETAKATIKSSKPNTLPPPQLRHSLLPFLLWWRRRRRRRRILWRCPRLLLRRTHDILIPHRRLLLLLLAQLRCRALTQSQLRRRALACRTPVSLWMRVRI